MRKEMMRSKQRPYIAPKTRPVQKTSAKGVGDIARAGLAPVVEKRVGLQTNLKMAWTDIVGLEMAQYIAPLKLDWPRRYGDDDPFMPATLIVACDPHRALFFQHETAALLERINLFLGFHAVSRITIKQEMPSDNEVLGETKQDKVPKLGAPLSDEEHRRIDAQIGDIENEKLRAALLKLGESVKRKNSVR